jgi:hypothetical protein
MTPEEKGWRCINDIGVVTNRYCNIREDIIRYKAVFGVAGKQVTGRYS